MAVVVAAALFFAALCGLALWANERFRNDARLPMQWWINGDVTWSAPRAVALALFPALALLVFAMLTLLPPRQGQEGVVLTATIATGAALIATQLLYFWLVHKTLRRK